MRHKNLRKLVGSGAGVLALYIFSQWIWWQRERLPMYSYPVGYPKFNSPLNDSKVAFLLETRLVPNIVPLMLHMLSVVPKDWPHLFMGTNATIERLALHPTLRRYKANGKLRFMEYPQWMPPLSWAQLSAFMADPYLYGEILAPAEYALVWQTDSILCANSPRSIDEFLAYDYVGAPWSSGPAYGGNGGLSLRRVSKAIRAIKARPRVEGEMEDKYFAEALKALNGSKMADRSVSMSFCMQEEGNDTYFPMGYHVGSSGSDHRGAIMGSPEKRSRLWEYCPEIRLLVEEIDAAPYVLGQCRASWNIQQDYVGPDDPSPITDIDIGIGDPEPLTDAIVLEGAEESSVER